MIKKILLGLAVLLGKKAITKMARKVATKAAEKVSKS